MTTIQLITLPPVAMIVTTRPDGVTITGRYPCTNTLRLPKAPRFTAGAWEATVAAAHAAAKRGRKAAKAPRAITTTAHLPFFVDPRVNAEIDAEARRSEAIAAMDTMATWRPLKERVQMFRIAR
jgi:hypothetical protein